MNQLLRRHFITQSGALIGLAASVRLNAALNDVPLGVQCYDLKDALAADFNGTWKLIAGLGYKRIDMVSFGGYDFAPKLAAMPAKDIKRGLTAAGLDCVVCHFLAEAFEKDYAGTLQYARELGASTLIFKPDFLSLTTLDKWKGVAKDLNRVGARVEADGLALGYHSRGPEFTKIAGIVPFDLLMAETDPKLVSFQIDVGNLTVGGGDAVTYIRKYRERYFAAHLKDVRNGQVGIALGEGSLNFKTILTELRKTRVSNYTIETESTPDKMVQTYTASIAYIHNLKV